MKRVSRPTRIALRQITTQLRPSASDARPIAWVPGMPISCATTSRLESPMSSARSTVRAPFRKPEISAIGAGGEQDRGDGAADAAGDREPDPEQAESLAAMVHGAPQVDEHERDGDEAQAAGDRRREHGDGTAVVELVVGHAQARQRADAAVLAGARQRVAEAGDRRALEDQRGGDAGADDQNGAGRRGGRRARGLPRLPREGFVAGLGRHRQAVRSGGPPIGVRLGPEPIARRGGSGSISLRPATRDTRSPAYRSRSSAGAATRIRASIRRTRARWAVVRAATGERL